MHILLVFCDGMGLGANDPATNPFFHAPMNTLRAWFGKIPTRDDGILYGDAAILVPTDAQLGVPGVPQSGTGQTTIFTGINAPAAIGQHLGPYPNDALRAILKRDNLFMQVQALGLHAAFGNAYPPFFFERLDRGKARRTATMQAALAAKVELRGVNALARGEAVSALAMDNHFWVERGAPVPLITPRIAGENLMRLAQQFDFTAFEYAPTDMAGHKDDRTEILRVLNEVDEFWSGIVAQMNPQRDLIIITSDHGNIEDWSIKGHTLNPVPTILIGAHRDELAPKIHSLVDITPAIVELLASQNGDLSFRML
ncbi:MAG TPA: peptidase [Anaerolineae bacterium]|nr:peptidase [Anaerolineae bacterium]